MNIKDSKTSKLDHTITCVGCGDEVEEAAAKINGVEDVSVNVLTNKISYTNTGDKTDEEVASEIQEIVDRVEPGSKVKTEGSEVGHTHGDGDYDFEFNKKRIIVAGLIAALSFLFGGASGSESLVNMMMLTAYVTVAYDVIERAVVGIFHKNPLDEHFLMSIATVGAIVISNATEAFMVMWLFQIGEYFQEKAVHNSKESVGELMDLTVDKARLVKGDEISIVDVEDIKIGDVVEVLAGEKIPLDGKVVEGVGFIDNSALTGESAPVEVKEGSEVLSGGLNTSTTIRMEVEKLSDQSTAAKIIELVDEANENKAETDKLITRFSRYYTPIVVFIALMIGIFIPFFRTGAIVDESIYTALTFLVVSCPCAFVISVPLGFFAGIGKGSKEGILFKGGNYIEALSEVDTVVFDKTGTLTTGEFALVASHSKNDDELHQILYAIERESTHPIAVSIVEALEGVEVKQAESIETLPGIGIAGNIDKKRYKLVNYEEAGRLMKEDEYFKELNEDRVSILTEVHIIDETNQKYLGYIEMGDNVKPGVAESIKHLKDLDIKTKMLTGDIERIAENVSERIGIDDYEAEMLPDEKLGAVKKLMNEGHKVAFVGDGINDAPVLVQSDVGFAMGGVGSDAAIEAAGIIVVNDDIDKVAESIALSQKVMRVVKQNIFVSIAVKLTVLGLSAAGLVGMWAAIFADVGVSFLAVMNSARILK